MFQVTVKSLDSLPRLAVLVGPAGIGKSRFFLENFSRLLHESPDPLKPDVLYLLPSAEHRERIVDLILRKEGSGFFGNRITTFNELISGLLRAGDFALVTDAERRFLLGEILASRKAEYFARVWELPGFLDRLNDFIGELKESLMSVKAFAQSVKELEKLRPEIGKKYAELLEIYEAYQTRLETLGLCDHRDGLFLLKETAKRGGAGPPAFRHLFVDGFFDFSKSQLEFLRWLCERSERVTLSLTAELSGEPNGIFKIPLETLAELGKIGFEPLDLSGAEDHRSRDLTGVLILEATGLRGEIEMIARQVRRFVRQGDPAGRPYHFSDFAVILRRIGEYGAILRAVFREFGIPVEIHERERLRDAPLARTLTSFFKILLDDWKREDLFNFLKSSYVERDYQEVCALELAGFRKGITAGRERWLKEVPSPVFEKINAFQERLAEPRTAEEWAKFTREALHTFALDRVPVAYEEGARRDFAALKRMESLLEEICRTNVSWGEPFKTFEVFAREFLGLLEVDLFSLHDRDKNRVQVYDVSLARQKEYKIVFLAGLLEKRFPAEIREDPIFSDAERRVTGLSERLPRQALERYLFYIGLTRARERVVLTYPRFDLEGHEALRSFYVDEVEKLFEGRTETRTYPVSQPLPPLQDAVEEREVEAHLVRRLHERGKATEREERTLTLALYNFFLEKPSFQKLLPRLLFNPEARIESPQVRAAFGPEHGIFKPTGLEMYGRCPYRYFAREVLGLEEKDEGIDVLQVGILLHEVLERYWKERVEEKRDELAAPERAREFIKAELARLLEADPLSGEKGYRIALKKAEMEEWLCRMIEKEIEEGAPLEPLTPRYLERKFGFSSKDYLVLHDPLREDLKIRGKIDRIDVDPSGKYAAVIGYKSAGEFKKRDLEWGVALQLPLYLLAVQQHLKLKPLAGLIYSIKAAEANGFFLGEGLGELGIRKGPQASVYNEEEFRGLLDRTLQFARRYAEGISRAEIPVRPRDCDKHCPYSSVCRIEKWRLPYLYQEIREEDPKRGTV